MQVEVPEGGVRDRNASQSVGIGVLSKGLEFDCLEFRTRPGQCGRAIAMAKGRRRAKGRRARVENELRNGRGKGPLSTS